MIERTQSGGGNQLSLLESCLLFFFYDYSSLFRYKPFFLFNLIRENGCAEADNNNRWLGESGVPCPQSSPTYPIYTYSSTKHRATERNVITVTPPLFNWVTCSLLLLFFFIVFPWKMFSSSSRWCKKKKKEECHSFWERGSPDSRIRPGGSSISASFSSSNSLPTA